MNKKKNKPRKPTERDAYLKKDFIERQPIYNEVPGQQETDPMMNMGPPGAQQQMAPPPEMAGLAPSLASFPGMPDIGGPGGSLLQNQRGAAATPAFQMGVPGPDPRRDQGLP